MPRSLTPEEAARETIAERLAERMLALADEAQSLGLDSRFTVTRRLLEASAWRITYKGEPNDGR
jgi:hypothetical protein